ncbi:hypothetical protein GJW-30_1_00188 [Variibacter gotjawalensis]|uniref:DUF304 domain-containing protein n=1 Tax=Variibacter gotjawalensis TaxID=1333996 RepID=A0A0S3PP75_9BRAD|nr:hypothetical protein [Variibacter gotjawalensis]NIK47974.1 hypothetical protein [Variibacter gotjawalensis]RZS49851.1 hypothetical protein EV661_2297 [Variibacter gotjawalensis]BAT57680.1 hypothetical protein GJW-30_1_00188 [Variibacter gotjawalensis]
MIEANNGRIIYRESLSAWIRAFALFLGLGCGTMIPYPFIIHARWSEPSWTLLLAAACIAFAVLVGLLFVIIALAGVQELVFHQYRRTLYRKLSGPLGVWRREIPFSQLSNVETATRETEDGPAPFVRFRVAGWKRAIELHGLGDRTSTDAWRDRIAAMIR